MKNVAGEGKKSANSWAVRRRGIGGGAVRVRGGPGEGGSGGGRLRKGSKWGPCTEGVSNFAVIILVVIIIINLILVTDCS